MELFFCAWRIHLWLLIFCFCVYGFILLVTSFCHNCIAFKFYHFKLPMTLLLFYPMVVYLHWPMYFYYFVALYSFWYLGFSLCDHSLTTVSWSFRISLGRVRWWSFLVVWLVVCFCLNTALSHPNFFFLFTIENFKHIQSRKNSIS